MLSFRKGLIQQTECQKDEYMPVAELPGLPAAAHDVILRNRLYMGLRFRSSRATTKLVRR